MSERPKVKTPKQLNQKSIEIAEESDYSDEKNSKDLNKNKELKRIPNPNEVKLDLIRPIEQNNNQQFNIQDHSNNNEFSLDVSQISSKRFLKKQTNRLSIENKNRSSDSDEQTNAKDKKESEDIAANSASKKTDLGAIGINQEMINSKEIIMRRKKRMQFCSEIQEQITISQGRTLIFDSFSSNQEAFVNFDFISFFKYFIYHLIYFFFLGPLFGLILLPFEGYKKLCLMGFLGINPSSIMQFMMFFCSAPNIILIVYFKFHYINPETKKLEDQIICFTKEELIFCLIAVFIRAFIIAARYGYTCKPKMIIREKGFDIPTEVIRREYVISGWRDLNIETVDIEIKYSILRNEIENELFCYNAISILSNDWIERLSIDNYLEKIAGENNEESIKKINQQMYLRADKRKKTSSYNIELNALKDINNKDRNENSNKEITPAPSENAKIKDNKDVNGNKIKNGFDSDFNDNNNDDNKNKGRPIDYKKYSLILPYLQKVKKAKEKKFDLEKNILKQLETIKKVSQYDNHVDCNKAEASLNNEEQVESEKYRRENSNYFLDDNGEDTDKNLKNDRSHKSKLNNSNKTNINSNLTANENNKSTERVGKRRKTRVYENLIKSFSRKMAHFKDSSRIIFNKIDEQILPEEQDLPIYLHKPDLEFILLPLPGRLFVRELMMLSKEKIKPNFLRLVIILSVLHSLIPIIYRCTRGEKVFGGNFLEGYLIIITFIVASFTYMVSMVFVEIGGNDFERKRYLLEGLSAMINPNKSRIERIRFRYLPLINIFCRKNLKSWLYMRILAMDVGLRYLKRIELYASIFLFVYTVITAILLLGLYDFLKFFKVQEFQLFYIMGFSESFIVFLVLYRMMYLGADINGFFKRHVNELNLIKSKFQDVINNFTKWKKMTNYLDSHLEKTKDYYYYCILFHQIKTPEEIEDLRENGYFMPNPLKTDENGNNEFVEYLKSLCEFYSQICDDLQLLEENSSLRLLGIKLDSELLAQFYFALMTIVFSLFQKFLDPKQ